MWDCDDLLLHQSPPNDLSKRICDAISGVDVFSFSFFAAAQYSAARVQAFLPGIFSNKVRYDSSCDASDRCIYSAGMAVVACYCLDDSVQCTCKFSGNG